MFFGGPQQRRGPIDNEARYKELGVAKTATLAEIKKAYRDLSKKYHPDRPNGDADKFKKISSAYEILSDTDKRAIYDRDGEEGLKNGGGGGGGGGPRGFPFRQAAAAAAKPKRGKDIQIQLNVPLSVVYRGGKKIVSIPRNVLCSVCSGKGGTGTAEQCVTCKGQGVQIVIRQLAPGMVQQMQAQCGTCKGAGKIMPSDKQCKPCAASGIVSKNQPVEINIKPGQSESIPMIVRGWGHEAPELETGDLQVMVKRHAYNEPAATTTTDPKSKIQISESHMIFPQTITLAQALTGFTLKINHFRRREYDDAIDDSKIPESEKRRILVVSSPPGHIVRPDDVMVVPGEGFPKSKNSSLYGDLFIPIKIQFPESNTLSAETIGMIKECLGPIVFDDDDDATTPAAAEDVAVLCASSMDMIKRRIDDEENELRQEAQRFSEEHRQQQGGGGGQQQPTECRQS